jgi:LysR family transcriptional activator of glutamate synthase operon
VLVLWLQFFLAVSGSLSFSAASDELYVSQSTLSKNIRALEEELGVSLFERTTRNVRLTKAGHEFIPYAKKILETYKDMNSALQQYRQADKNGIRLVTFPVMHLYGLSNLLAEFKRLHPSIKLQISEADMNLAMKKLVLNDVDIALVREVCLTDISNYHIHHLFDDEITLICDKQHPFASRESVSLSELAKEPIVCLNTGITEYQKALAPFGYDHLLSDNISATVTTSLALQQLVSRQFGVSLISKSIALYMADQYNSLYNIAIVPLEEHPPFSLCIATPKRPVSAYCQELIDFLRRAHNA